jgi:hypothetical protein
MNLKLVCIIKVDKIEYCKIFLKVSTLSGNNYKMINNLEKDM